MRNALNILMRRASVTSKKQIYENKYHMMFDGGSRGNPGPSAAGAVIYKNNKEVATISKFLLGNQTNNYAEYMGLILGLKKALDMEIKNLYVEGDSLLIINQCKGLWQTKTFNLIQLNAEAMQLCNKFEYISLNHITRDKNKRADQLVNQAMVLQTSASGRSKF